ncbi:hypothetical protein UR09_04590 [Candidatus Nitromaritima sp. SCGC AAA799-A02]|nr:hypothetical protein UR09_04590 [Candidatus Nitromaritima sp. SCGC AAA799-A02]
MSSCETASSKEECSEEKDCCPVEKSLEALCCPVEATAQKGNKAFFKAMCEVQVESLKERIREAWGDKIDQKSDAIVKAMGTHWQSLLAQAKAQKDLREEIGKIYFS